MAFDFKKEYKALYLPTTQPAIVQVPAAGYLAVRGTGDPNQEGGPYQKAIGILYAVAYTIKMSDKTDRQIPGFFPYVVPPLEGFWWQEGVQGIDYSNKSALQWISVIRLPDFVSRRTSGGRSKPPPGRRSWTAPRWNSSPSTRGSVSSVSTSALTIRNRKPSPG